MPVRRSRRLTTEQPLQDLARRAATHIGDDGSQLAGGVLQHRLQSVGESGSLGRAATSWMR
jgi:hypothetical protein